MIEIRIQLDPQTGRINVNGAIDDLVLAYGLLEVAKDAIHNHAQQKAAQGPAPKIVVPELAVPAGLTNGKR